MSGKFEPECHGYEMDMYPWINCICLIFVSKPEVTDFKIRETIVQYIIYVCAKFQFQKLSADYLYYSLD